MTVRILRPLMYLMGLAAMVVACEPARAASADPVTSVGSAAFWQHWGDGQAEIATYDLQTKRYGEMRRGMAVAIFVTEEFSVSDRVKADAGRHPKSDVVPVMKLNFVEDFQTGIYDYNLMTSAFVALAPHAGLPSSGMVKTSFSSQEWCGHVYHQLLFDRKRVRETSHSYFDGEADQLHMLAQKPEGLSEDVLWLWARGLIGPALKPGEKVTRPVLLSARNGRLLHRTLDWQEATLSRDAASRKVTVSAGTFETLTLRVERAGQVTVYDVEVSPPHRIIRVTTPDGGSAVLRGGKRLPYWKLNGNKDEAALNDIGL